jgi:hypothetical protein
MKSKTKINKETEMDCQFCGKKNVDKVCVIFTKPVPDCPFSMNQGKGMICLECWEKQEAQDANEKEIAGGEARYRQSVLGDEA